MNGMRNTGYVVSLALLASLFGHFAIHKYFERRSQAQLRSNQPELAYPQISALFSSEDLPESLLPGNHRKSRPPRRGQQIVAASDIHEEETQPSPVRRPNPPTAVPAPADAWPVETSSKDDVANDDENTSAVREVIEWELSTASREEREIWFEELKSLPAGVVSDLLQVRKQLHALPKLLGGMPEKLASTDPVVFPRTQEISAEPASQRIRFNVSDQHFATEALESAISQLRHNLVNFATPGFKRLRVTLVDVYSSRNSDATKSDDRGLEASSEPSPLGEGCRIGPVLIDMKPGFLKKTTRELDVAIEGNGFFVVRRAEKDYLTRCGALRLDRHRQLCLSVFPDSAVLQPAIKIPEDAVEIQISQDGVVSSRNSEDASFLSLGRMQLACVADSSSLEPCGNLVFQANDDSGEFVLGDPAVNGRGHTRQGYLEQSNVDLEQELSEIDEISMILKAIPQQNSRPATARSLHQAPAR